MTANGTDTADLVVRQPGPSGSDPNAPEEDVHQLQQVENTAGAFCGAALSATLGLLFFPITIFSCYTVDVMQETLVFRWGRYQKTVKEPGLHFDNMWGRDLRSISTKRATCDLPVTTIVDANGNPLNISAVVVYSYVDTMRAALSVDDADQYIRTQAEAALKQVVSKFPYESNDEKVACLKKEAEEVGRELVEALQKKATAAGAKVHSFQLQEMSYAPSIAAGMLRRQQAAALVEARQTIVKGAVDIAVEAVTALEEHSIKMTEEEKTRLVTNLLTVICSDQNAQPTVPLSSN
eukprot:comp8799_c0_seq1/m.4020 comp8799_c0_seq1/g.4020  ORF comp8799_c0_seq1/g.4020 comp8799_c0_seq1/m.4020 type:complete len:293 (-) comp8799_c0_seq1:402-1280(-)